MKTVSAKIYPTPSQERSLLRFLNVTRWIFNRALEHRIKAYKRRRESIGYSVQQSLLTKWRSRIERIAAVPVHIERDALRRVERGMQSFFRRVKAGQKPGFPRFKSRLRWRSFEVLHPQKYLRDNDRVYIPGVGPVKYRGMMGFVGAIKGLRVIRRECGWYVQLIVDDGPKPAARPIERRIGIDVGLASFATLSDGTKFDNPRWYRAGQRRLPRSSVAFRRMVKGPAALPERWQARLTEDRTQDANARRNAHAGL